MMKLKKLLFIIMMCTFIVVIIVYYNIALNKERFIELEMMGECSADFSEVYYGYGSKIKEDFTWWYQVRSEVGLEGLAERFKIDISNIKFNFKDRYMIVSFGRKLDGLVYRKKDERSEDKLYCAYPKFDRKSYAKKAYIYSMDKLPLADMELYGVSFIAENYKNFEDNYVNVEIGDEESGANGG